MDESYNFEIILPLVENVALIDTLEIDGFFGLERKRFTYNCSATDHVNLAYGISILEIQENQSGLTNEDYILSNYESVKAESNAIEISSEWIEFRGVKTLKTEMYNEEKNVYIYNFFFIHEKRDFRLGVITRNADKDNWLIATFLRSFTFLDQEPELADALKRD